MLVDAGGGKSGDSTIMDGMDGRSVAEEADDLNEGDSTIIPGIWAACGERKDGESTIMLGICPWAARRLIDSGMSTSATWGPPAACRGVGAGTSKGDGELNFGEERSEFICGVGKLGEIGGDESRLPACAMFSLNFDTFDRDFVAAGSESAEPEAIGCG